ncbi:hypothetical protein QE152_g31007 [Popillia japonica]|uniref:Uncharacterized protein n=1 Tax=Popillia japonica TaxID=7064 RepID=A0AAW1JCI3_POPJA
MRVLMAQIVICPPPYISANSLPVQLRIMSDSDSRSSDNPSSTVVANSLPVQLRIMSDSDSRSSDNPSSTVVEKITELRPIEKRTRGRPKLGLEDQSLSI